MLGIDRTSTTRFARVPARISVISRNAHHRTRRAWRVEQLEGRTLLSTWPVTLSYDTGQDTPGTLRWAIDGANANKGDDTIDIQVSSIKLKSALPDLSDTNHLTEMKGPGAASLTVARSSDPGTPYFRIFTIDAGTRVSLSGLTVSNESADQGYSEGGGIYNDGNLAISNSVIASCSAYRGGGILNNGTLMLIHSSILGNNAIGYNGGGGGIYSRGTLTVTDCTFANNSTDWYGGGIVGVAGGTMTITGTDVVHNSGVMGAGGIFNDCKTPNTLTNSTVAYNSAGGTGGGGIGIYGGWMTIVNSTIAYNNLDNAAGSGGGLYSERDGPLYTLYNTIVALNTRSTGNGPAPSDIAAMVSSSSAHNLVGTGGSGGLIERIRRQPGRRP